MCQTTRRETSAFGWDNYDSRSLSGPCDVIRGSGAVWRILPIDRRAQWGDWALLINYACYIPITKNRIPQSRKNQILMMHLRGINHISRAVYYINSIKRWFTFYSQDKFDCFSSITTSKQVYISNNTRAKVHLFVIQLVIITLLMFSAIEPLPVTLALLYKYWSRYWNILCFRQILIS